MGRCTCASWRKRAGCRPELVADPGLAGRGVEASYQLRCRWSVEGARGAIGCSRDTGCRARSRIDRRFRLKVEVTVGERLQLRREGSGQADSLGRAFSFRASLDG